MSKVMSSAGVVPGTTARQPLASQSALISDTYCSSVESRYRDSSVRSVSWPWRSRPSANVAGWLRPEARHHDRRQRWQPLRRRPDQHDPSGAGTADGRGKRRPVGRLVIGTLRDDHDLWPQGLHSRQRKRIGAPAAAAGHAEVQRLNTGLTMRGRNLRQARVGRQQRANPRRQRLRKRVAPQQQGPASARLRAAGVNGVPGSFGPPIHEVALFTVGGGHLLPLDAFVYFVKCARSVRLMARMGNPSRR